MLSLSLGATPIPVTTTKDEADAVVAALNAHNDRIFKVTIISTAIVGLSAMLTAFRTFRQLRRDEALFAKHAQHLQKKR
jgi:hypothetical protein